MKRNCIKQLAGFFLVCLFIFNGLCPVLPSLFTDGKAAIENVFSPETEKNSTEDKGEKAIKEIYLNNIHPAELSALHFSFVTILMAEKPVYKKDIHLSIPTPPPEFI